MSYIKFDKAQLVNLEYSLKKELVRSKLRLIIRFRLLVFYDSLCLDVLGWYKSCLSDFYLSIINKNIFLTIFVKIIFSKCKTSDN